MSVATSDASDTQPARILLVDDDRLVLATLAKSLRNEGYDVTTADSGTVALELANTETFDLAILDMRMPSLSGSETARRLRSEFGIPFIFLSAHNDKDLIQEGVDEGAHGYLIKPLQATQIVPAIESALARARDIDSLQDETQNLERALAGRRYTSMAVGIMMERRGLCEKAAFEALRNSARKQQRKLEDVSRELVAALERLNEI